MQLLRWLSPFRLIDGLFARLPWLARRKALLQLVFAGLFGAALALFVSHRINGPSQRLTQEDIDKAVAHALGAIPLPSQASRAAEIVEPSVVRVNGFTSERDAAKDPVRYEAQGVGSGVLIVDTGLILTNLHVVQAADKIMVTFHDGHESEATIKSVQADQDLAVLQVKTLPDDPKPATMRSTADLAKGDLVVAVGFPFGIGPSVSAGVVSGLRREFQSPEGKRPLTNLIQFDAAANPGNSGGPLVTADGEVVGIVTGILNPSGAKVFAGIGFAVPIENATAGMGISPF
jgi:S1-C subfamily serine protease